MGRQRGSRGGERWTTSDKEAFSDVRVHRPVDECAQRLIPDACAQMQRKCLVDLVEGGEPRAPGRGGGGEPAGVDPPELVVGGEEDRGDAVEGAEREDGVDVLGQDLVGHREDGLDDELRAPVLVAQVLGQGAPDPAPRAAGERREDEQRVQPVAALALAPQQVGRLGHEDGRERVVPEGPVVPCAALERVAVASVVAQDRPAGPPPLLGQRERLLDRLRLRVDQDGSGDKGQGRVACVRPPLVLPHPEVPHHVVDVSDIL